MKTKMLRVPDETRFVSALALAVDPGDTLSFLTETGAVSGDDMAIVRYMREDMLTLYDQAAAIKDWAAADTANTLLNALQEPDYAGYLVYYHRLWGSGPQLKLALAAILYAKMYRYRPWTVSMSDAESFCNDIDRLATPDLSKLATCRAQVCQRSTQRLRARAVRAELLPPARGQSGSTE